MVNEYVLATITTYILGNSIEQFSMVIASMMLMMGVSGLVQSKMSDRGLLQKFIAVEVLMAILGGFSPLAIYAAYGYLENSFQIVHYFFVLSVGFLIGFEIPLVMRIIDQQKINLRTNLTIVYAMDYVGAFIGALIWVKFLLKNFPLTEISFIVAGFNFIVASLTILYFLKSGIIKSAFFYIAILIITAMLLAAGFMNNRDISNLLEQRFYDDPIVFKSTTKYQHLVLTHNSSLNDTRLYINGSTQFSSVDEARYHDFLVHPVMAANSEARHVLIIGGGDGLALREVNKYSQIQSITLVDLDPEMVRIASEHPVLTHLNHNAFRSAKVQTAGLNISSPGIREGIYMEETDGDRRRYEWVASVDVFNVDAFQFLKEDPAQLFDVVIIDLPDPSSVELSKLYSTQFYRSLRRHINPSGYLSVQSTSPYHAKEAYLAIGTTLRASGYKALPYRQNVPSFGDWGYYLAWPGDESEAGLRERLINLSSFSVPTDFITSELLAASFAFGKGELTALHPCINTLMEPCLLNNYVDRSWNIE